MSTIEKLKDRFYADRVPNDMTTAEICRLADHYKCIVWTGGNHQIAIRNPRTGKKVPLPQHSDTINPAYIRELRELFDDEEMEK